MCGRKGDAENLNGKKKKNINEEEEIRIRKCRINIPIDKYNEEVRGWKPPSKNNRLRLIASSPSISIASFFPLKSNYISFKQHFILCNHNAWLFDSQWILVTKNNIKSMILVQLLQTSMDP